MSFLLDTCFVSELTKGRRNPGVIAWLEGQEEEELFLSRVTVGEIEKGLAKLGDPSRRKKLREFLEAEILDRFRERLLETDGPVWRRWGVLSGQAEKSGKPLPVLDALVAAVAEVNGLTVVTRNEDDFQRCGVPVLNPWT